MLYPVLAPFARLFFALWTITFNGAQPVKGVGTAGVPDVNVVTVQGVTNGTAVPVSGTFWPATQPVSASSLPLPTGASQEHTTAASPHAVRLTDGVAFFKPTTPSDTQPVSGTFWQATQPVSGTVTANQGAAGVTAWKVDGSAVTQPVSGTVSVNALPAGTNLIGSVSLGNSTGKTAVMKTGALASSAVTADQVILTYAVTSGKTLYLEYIDVTARLTTYAATATLFGSASLEIVAGTKMYTTDVFHAGALNPSRVEFAEPIPVAAGTVIRWVCTPSATTAMSWKANFGGYEK